MANDTHAPELGRSTEPSITALVKGIVDDAMVLMRQQLAMFKAELRSDLARLRDGIIPIVLSIAPMLLGGLMSCFALVHLIHWLATPAGAVMADPAHIPLWGCYAIVAGTFLLIGGILVAMGIVRLKSVNPLPEESVKALEENVKWLMNNPK